MRVKYTVILLILSLSILVITGCETEGLPLLDSKDIISIVFVHWNAHVSKKVIQQSDVENICNLLNEVGTIILYPSEIERGLGGGETFYFEYASGNMRQIGFDGFNFIETVNGENIYYRIESWKAGKDKYTFLDSSGMKGFNYTGPKVATELMAIWDELDYEEKPVDYYL